MSPLARRMRWKLLPLGVGSACMLAGGWLVVQGWRAAVTQGISASAAGSLGLGAALGVFGLLTVLGPHLAPLLYRLYGDEAFASRGLACPVVSKCQRCGEFNFRGKPACKACGMTLVWGAKPQAPG